MPRVLFLFFLPSLLVMSTTASAATAPVDEPSAPEATPSAHTNVSPWHFRLTKGAGTPVCDAYLQRLKLTEFEHPPYCGRPENDSVPGFASLHRVPLSPEEILALHNHVSGLMLDGDQYALDHRADRLRSLGMKPPEHSLANVQVSLRAGWLNAWRYQPPVDIENDGSRDNLVMWFGEGASPGAGVCGAESSNLPYPFRAGQVALFITPAGSSIDVEATAKIFGHPYPYAATKEGANRAGLRMIGPEIGVFQYQGLFYFDTFFDALGDWNNARSGNPKLIDTLGVFLRAEGKTREICEYRMQLVQPSGAAR